MSSRATSRARPFALAATLLASPLAPAPAAAQQVGPGGDGPAVRLTLARAIERALELDEDVRAARARVAQAEARLDVQRAGRLPQIGSQLQYTRTFRSIFDGLQLDGAGGAPFRPDTTLPLEERVRRIEGALARGAVGGAGAVPGGFLDASPFGQENAWVAALTLDQLLYAGGRTRAAIAGARSAAQAARFALADTEAEVALDVAEAYFDAVLGDALVAIATASLDLAEQQATLTRTRFAEGAVAELDVLRAELERENLVPQLVDAQDAREAARLRLLALVELPLDAEPALVTEFCAPVAGGRPDALPPPDEADALLDAQPAVLAAEREAAARAAEVRVERAARLPTVSLFGNLGWQAFPDQVLPFDEWREDWFAGVEVQFPIFTGGERGARIRLARAELAEAVAETDRVREAVRVDYRRAYGEVARAWSQVVALQRTVDRALRIYALTRLRYAEGVAIQLEVLDALVALQQAQTNLVEGYHDYVLALARAERALGRTVSEARLPTGPCPTPDGQTGTP